MSSNSSKRTDYFAVLGGILAALAAIVTVLGFFGIVRFPFLSSGSSTPSSPPQQISSPVFPPNQQTNVINSIQTTSGQNSSLVSNPVTTLTAFCNALYYNNSSVANNQLTPRYLNYIESHTPTNDPYTGCTFGLPLRESSTSEGVIYYYTISIKLRAIRAASSSHPVKAEQY